VNDINPLQLQLSMEFRDRGVLTVTFKGRSQKDDIDLFRKAIDANLSPNCKVKKVIFDLAQIHPIMNAAGRLLDLACSYHKTCRIPIEVRMPAEIYSVLQEITPKEMQPPPVQRTRVRGVDVVIVPQVETEKREESSSLRILQLEEVLREPKIVMSCVGKVRSVMDSVVTVSLFADSDEVVGELDRSQFPNGSVVPGMVFEYRAVVTSPGTTETSIEFACDQQPSDDDLMDLAKEISKGVQFERL
jgi:hypothetical protein